MAAVNLTVGVWMSLQPRRLGDMRAVTGWSRSWTDGVNVYADPASGVDYPPWALVLLSPLAALPPAWQPVIWVACNLALAGALICLLLRFAGEQPRASAGLAWLLASAACLRVLDQFTLLSYTLAVAGIVVPSAAIGGLAIGTSLIKPQVGGVVLLWTLLRRDWRRAWWAAAAPTALSLVFILVSRTNPLSLVAQYGRALWSLYGSPMRLPGHSELRPWVWRLWPGTGGNVAVTIVLAGALLAPLFWAAAARHPFRSADRRLEMLALCGVVSLLVVRHLSYDFVLLFPALVAWRTPPFSDGAHAPRALFYTLAALIVLSVPSWARLAVRAGGPRTLAGLTQLDRVMCLAAWTALAVRVTRRRPPNLSVVS